MITKIVFLSDISLTDDEYFDTFDPFYCGLDYPGPAQTSSSTDLLDMDG